MQARNDDHDDAWLREQIAEILRQGWTMEELNSVGITRAMLARLGFRDDHPGLFNEPPPREHRSDPGGRRAKQRKEAASRMQREAASAFGASHRGHRGTEMSSLCASV